MPPAKASIFLLLLDETQASRQRQLPLSFDHRFPLGNQQLHRDDRRRLLFHLPLQLIAGEA